MNCYYRTILVQLILVKFSLSARKQASYSPEDSAYDVRYDCESAEEYHPEERQSPLDYCQHEG